MIIRDRIDYTVQNLLISKYEHMFQHILTYSRLCMRDDVFAVLALIYDAESEEQYLDKIKRFIAYVKLVAPEIMEIYEIHNRIEVARRIIGSSYYLDIPLRDLADRKFQLEKDCDEYV